MNGDIESTIASLVVEIQSMMGEAKRLEEEAQDRRVKAMRAKAAVNALEHVQGRPPRFADADSIGSGPVSEKKTYKARAPRGAGLQDKANTSAETKRVCDAVYEFLRGKGVPLSSESVYSGMLATGFSWPKEWAGKNAIRCIGQTLKWDGRFNRDNGIGWGINPA